MSQNTEDVYKQQKNKEEDKYIKKSYDDNIKYINIKCISNT